MPNYTLRTAVPDDAQSIIDYLGALADEPYNNTSLSPGERPYTLEAERKIIVDMEAAPNSLMLLAVDPQGQMVGLATLAGGSRAAVYHTAVIGLSLRPEWRGQGIGTELMRGLIDYARQGGVLKRLELLVLTSNERGIHIYRKLGFVEEGIHKGRLFKDGAYVDDLSMALLLD
ncbi:MAG: GNAT family N-acetyltransferase [Anaerolineae bacterium]|nr:GNAT family N-acetyltransferase [Anaerolineae bacterium]